MDITTSSPILWDRKRIDATFPLLFEEWQRRRNELSGSAAYWSDAFLKTSLLGRRLRKALQHAKISPEAYLWRLTGPIKTEWRRFRCEWDPDVAHEQLRAAHIAWKQDRLHGKPAGRHFTVYYLIAHGWRRVYAAVSRHHRKGIADFVREDRIIAPDWVYKGPVSMAEVRRDLLLLFDRWRVDPLGLPIGRSFGKTYLMIAERTDLVSFVERHGIRRVLQTRRLASLRAIWGKRIPGKDTRAWREKRRISFRAVRPCVASKVGSS